MLSRTSSVVAMLTVWLLVATAHATPGPDSVAILANADIPESVALAQSYADARQVPARQLCALSMPTTEDISLAEFQNMMLGPLLDCLSTAGVLDRIEGVLLIRGVPLRVVIPTPDGDMRTSVAAAIGVWRSVMTDTGEDFIGQPPGVAMTCSGGSACTVARWANAYRSGPFEPDFTATRSSVEWHPVLVTMLHGRSYEDAQLLIDSALAAEAAGAVPGEVLLMRGRDAARGVLDTQYDAVAAALTDRGLTDVNIVDFAADETGHTLAGFFTGTATLGTTIEGNTFAPGCLVDNLTSVGAAPINFHMTGESQVSIARWVAMGVAGVHGTTAEPLNNAFPSRFLYVDYVDGATLAEAYAKSMPFVYWQNLVLGDPMLAPYAKRPEVVVEGVASGDALIAAAPLSITATDPLDRGPVSIELYLDGVAVAHAESSPLELCLAVADDGPHQLLAVARAADDTTGARPYRPKGWQAVRFDSTGATGDCTAPDAGVMTDAGTPDLDAGAGDGGTDAGRMDGGPDAGASSGGCGCSLARGRGPSSALGFFVLFGALWLRRRSTLRRR